MHTVVENCCRVFHVLVKHGMSIRDCEIQRLVVDLVYLMRYGVFMNGVVVLQRIQELEQLLPPESTLYDLYGVHPKYITEMENRISLKWKILSSACSMLLSIQTHSFFIVFSLEAVHYAHLAMMSNACETDKKLEDEHSKKDNEADNGNSQGSKSWNDAFFDEHNIVNTMQCLLIDTSKTIEDLSALCVAMHNNNVVLSFTHRGLMPIASAHMYIFPYTKMNKEQLRILRCAIAQTEKTFKAVFQELTYNVHGMPQAKVDSVVILFAVNCLLLHGLSTSHLRKNGFSYTKLDNHNVLHHVNATLFTIIHACNMRSAAANVAARLLHKHCVRIDC